MTEKKEIKGRFKPGQSGNPAGKKPGTTDWRGDLRRQMLHEAPKLVAKCIQLAEEGNESMLKLVLDKIIPNIKGEFLSKGMVKSYKKGDALSLIECSESISQALSDEMISTTAAKTAQELIEGHARIVNAVLLEDRVKRIEDMLEKKKE